MDEDQQEVMLKKKAVLLEEYLRNGGMEPRAVEDRIDILNARIDVLEAELTQKGKANAARRYIQHAPQSDFNAINRVMFMQWFNGEEITVPVSMPAPPPVAVAATPLHTTGFQAINAPVAVNHGQTRPREPSSPSAMSNKQPKRQRITEHDRPPCLRCKILKKKCDSLNHCDHCPEQSYENEADFWKVLGCYRGKVGGLVIFFCPEYSRSTQRELRTHNGEIKTIKYVLTQSSQLTPAKKRRILFVVNSQPDVQRFEPEAWDNLERRKALSLIVATPNELPDGDDTVGLTNEIYEACWSVLQLMTMDPVYMGATKYNFFALLRLGYSIAAQQPDAVTLFQQAAGLLRLATELYLLESLCARMASGNFVGAPPFYAEDDSSSTLILVNIENDMAVFLREVESACSSRAKLFGLVQLDCFLAILLFSTAKTLLIDAYSFREKYENKTPWRPTDSMKITSAFKTIISVFCWSSRSDVIHQPAEELPSAFAREILDKAKDLVQQDKWEERGLKGTKEFLLTLGTSSTLDTRYNGFLAQKFTTPQVAYPNHYQARQSPLVLSQKARRNTSLGFMDIYSDSSATGQTPNHKKTNGVDGHDDDMQQRPTRSGIQQRLSSPTPSVESLVFTTDATSTENSTRKHGGRKGALDAETSKKAKEMRKLGSCWNCWTSRMGCSEGTPCERCTKAKLEINCFRAPFRNFSRDLLPDPLKSHYTADTIAKYISNHIPRFEGEPADLDVRWGETLTLNVPIALFKEETQSQATGYSIGIEFDRLKLVRERCVTKLTTAVTSSSVAALELVEGRTSELSQKILEIVMNFNHSQAHPLIRDALTVYLAFDASYRLVSFTQESIGELPEGTSAPALDTLQYQIRWVLQNLAQELLPVLLGDMERVYRNRDKAFWPIAFASSLIVFSCIEQFQSLAFEHLDNPFEYCSQVDSGPILRMMQSFHLRYRTHRHDSVGLNPFADGFSFADEPGFDTSAKRLVHDLQKIMGSGEALEEKAVPLNAETADEIVERNSGRLVSKFLMSFLDVGEI